ncbi:oxidoreductase [Knoellia sinensis KCTC 19936]|uniref:Oxidoreductase n=1 Tax=Knoellia sinensis KCTC 19936 TaxID=1385520 RepID=A0A0A0J4I5_9MICO|nr:PDR/VanB family oxidoreductase [Knoellia sinensis]KGN32113.1 oxidoreductase [Knoellia sinensis KCTC 19936]
MTTPRGASLAASRTVAAAAATTPSRTLRTLGRAAHQYPRVVTSDRWAAKVDRSDPQRRDGYDLSLVIAAKEIVAGDVAVFTFAAPTGGVLPAWSPGAHVDVLLPRPDGSTLMRQYSLNGDPADRTHWRIAVRRIDPAAGGGGGSVAMHALEVGDRVTLRGPRNAFNFVSGTAYRFVAGGIGITPILPMVRAAAAAGADWTLVYAGRSRSSMPFVDELVALDSARVTIHTDDEEGQPDTAALLQDLGDDTAVYLCGPSPMIDAARALIPPRVPDASLRGVSLHTERFSPPPVVGGRPFSVTLARTGATVEVAADESALAAIQRVLPDVRYSCKQGFCGSCEVGVLKGSIEHRGSSMRAVDGADSMLVCVSRAEGDALVVDL